MAHDHDNKQWTLPKQRGSDREESNDSAGRRNYRINKYIFSDGMILHRKQKSTKIRRKEVGLKLNKVG